MLQCRLTGVQRLRAQRLAGQIDALEEDVDYRVERAGSGGSWEAYVRKNLCEAKKYLGEARSGGRGSKLQSAWLRWHRARRFLYESYDDDERLERARALRREAEEKLTNWRKGAVLRILPANGDQPLSQDRSPTTGALVLAQFLLDEHFSNMYFKLEVFGKRVRQLSVLLAAITVLLVLAVVSLNHRSSSPIFLSTPQLVLTLALGVVGAGVSMALTLTKLTGRIPEVLRGVTETSLRPLVGALSAVIVVGIGMGELIPLEPPTDAQIAGYALLAGFSDQILVRVVDAAEKGITGSRDG